MSATVLMDSWRPRARPGDLRSERPFEEVDGWYRREHSYRPVLVHGKKFNIFSGKKSKMNGIDSYDINDSPECEIVWMTTRLFDECL